MAAPVVTLPARIVSVAADGFALWVPCKNAQQMLAGGRANVGAVLRDARVIDVQQRKYIYAMLHDISAYTGYTPEQAKSLMKYDYIAKTGAEYFSLSDCSVSEANAFLTFLIDFCLQNDIPTMENLAERSPDIARYLYACLCYKKCCITGGKAELHHLDTVGMGRNRREIVHLGYRVLPLTRAMHTEAHTIGNDTFCKKYSVFGIQLDRNLCKIWNVKD